MIHIWKECKELLCLVKERKVTIRGTLMLYLLSLIFAALGMGAVLLAVTGGFGNTERQISQALESLLHTTSDKISREMETYTGYGLQRSKQLSKDIENLLEEEGLEMQELDNHADSLLELQKTMYAELNTMIRMGRSSGAFAVVNATVNTKAPGAGHSRCGVYLRLINVSSNVILEPETILFRGNAEIARKNGLELHNRWNMEFDTEEFPGWQRLIEGGEGYFWTRRMNLKDTWEDVILLCVPVQGRTGEIYGICGVELNAVHFKLEYPAVESPYGSMITVLAPVEDGKIRVDQGMTGNTEGTWLEDTENLSVTERKLYNTYFSLKGQYYGVQEMMEIPCGDGTEWAAVVLVPRESCDQYIRKNRICMIAIAAGFTCAMLLLALILSKRFVQSVLQGVRDICEGQETAERKYGYTELEAMRKWLALREKPPKPGELPPDILELFECFSENVKKLTPAEYNIFRYYLQGYEISRIPEAAFISMSTVKKHNGNIYKKLEISSNAELMLYLDLFRRCGRLDELERNEVDGTAEQKTKEGN